jgi:hypothetical protein
VINPSQRPLPTQDNTTQKHKTSVTSIISALWEITLGGQRCRQKDMIKLFLSFTFLKRMSLITNCRVTDARSVLSVLLARVPSQYFMSCCNTIHWVPGVEKRGRHCDTDFHLNWNIVFLIDVTYELWTQPYVNKSKYCWIKKIYIYSITRHHYCLSVALTGWIESMNLSHPSLRLYYQRITIQGTQFEHCARLTSLFTESAQTLWAWKLVARDRDECNTSESKRYVKYERKK